MTSRKDTHANHPAPVTRRDFLAKGTIASSAMVFMPKAFADALTFDTCDQSGSVKAMPFLVFDMAGGAALPGNFLVGKEGGPEDLLASYDQLGWNPKAAGAYDKRFGLPMPAGQLSGIFRGITE